MVLSPKVASIKNPSLAFMLPRLSRWIALGFGSGLVPLMPGTVGTLVAWLLFYLFSLFLNQLPIIGFWIFWCLSVAIGCWACRRTGEDLGVSDHGAMVWDEFVAFWLVLAIIPTSFLWQLSGFLVFRFFDMAKPPPISWIDRHVKGGVGVMLDDLVAAAFTLFFLAWFM